MTPSCIFCYLMYNFLYKITDKNTYSQTGEIFNSLWLCRITTPDRNFTGPHWRANHGPGGFSGGVQWGPIVRYVISTCQFSFIINLFYVLFYYEKTCETAENVEVSNVKLSNVIWNCGSVESI